MSYDRERNFNPIEFFRAYLVTISNTIVDIEHKLR